MSFNNTIAALKELRDFCKNSWCCDDCKFKSDDGCVLMNAAYPADWKLPTEEDCDGSN